MIDLRKATRLDWESEDENLKNEHLALGCLLRIADALETQNKLITELSARSAGIEKQNLKLIDSNKKLRARIKELKK